MIQWKMITEGAKVVKKVAIRYAPQILTGIGIGCMAGATVHAIKVSPKAKEELDEIDNEELTHGEFFKKKAGTWIRYYWPEVLMVFGGAGLIIGGQHISLKRLSAATIALSMEREKVQKLTDKVAEKFGDKKLAEIQDEIAQDDVKREVVKQGITDFNTVYNTGRGHMLCFDPIGRRFFLSDLEYIRKMSMEFNKDIAEQMAKQYEAVMSLNDWYDYIDIPPLDGKVDGKTVGPNIGKDMGWRNRLMKLKITSGMLENDQTYFVIGFTDGGMPTIDENIMDDYLMNSADDSTDMPWRGR